MARIIEASSRFKAASGTPPTAVAAAPVGRPPSAAGNSLEVTLGHASQQGLRPDNEDFVGAVTPEGAPLAAKGLLLAIADGVGGHARGREAAEY